MRKRTVSQTLCACGAVKAMGGSTFGGTSLLCRSLSFWRNNLKI